MSLENDRNEPLSCKLKMLWLSKCANNVRLMIFFPWCVQVLPTDREFRNAAIEAGEVVWKSGLVKKVGLADGAAGNAYAVRS